MDKLKKIGIILKPEKNNSSLFPLKEIFDFFRNDSVSFCFCTDDQIRVGKIIDTTATNVYFLNKQQLLLTNDLIICLGGDGTLIGLCHQLPVDGPPIFSVNLGGLGFLTEFSVHDFLDGLGNLTSNNLVCYKIIPFYQIELLRDDRVHLHEKFINDAVINQSTVSRLFSLQVSSQKQIISTLSGDGVIISSPLGSTAYSLAAGGPIVHPEVDALAITPICAHSLNSRPLIVPASTCLEIRIDSAEYQISLTLDGQKSFDLLPGDAIHVKGHANRYVKLISNPSRSYFNTLREKFKYGERR